MQSSAAVAGRALIMLACVVGIPVLAMSGSSWSEILKKLQDFRLPAILDPAAASTSAPSTQLAQAPPTTSIQPNRSVEPANPGIAPANYQAADARSEGDSPIFAETKIADSPRTKNWDSPRDKNWGSPETKIGAVPAPIPSATFRSGCGHWEPHTTCWSRGESRSRCIVSIAGWRSAEIRTTRTTSRPPTPTPFAPCSGCCGKWKRGDRACGNTLSSSKPRGCAPCWQSGRIGTNSGRPVALWQCRHRA